MPTAGSRSGLPDFGGTAQPPARARFSGVTRKVSSYSIHTLLCSDEHKNPSEDGLRESRPRPLRRTLRRALSLGGKGRGFVRRFSGVENATRCQTDATSCHLRRKRYKRHFFLVYLRQEPTHGGRSGRLYTGIVHPAYSRTIRTSYARRANGYGSQPNVGCNIGQSVGTGVRLFGRISDGREGQTNVCRNR